MTTNEPQATLTSEVQEDGTAKVVGASRPTNLEFGFSVRLCRGTWNGDVLSLFFVPLVPN